MVLRIVFSIVCIILILGLLTSLNIFNLGVTYNNLKESLSESFKNIKTSEKNCPDGIIPEELIFRGKYWTSDRIVSPKSGYDCISSWADGTKLDKVSYGYLCRSAENKGENENFYYCEDLIYSAQPISEMGELGKLLEYNINLVIEEDSTTRTPGEGWEEELFTTDTHYRVISASCLKI